MLKKPSFSSSGGNEIRELLGNIVISHLKVSELNIKFVDVFINKCFTTNLYLKDISLVKILIAIIRLLYCATMEYLMLSKTSDIETAIRKVSSCMLKDASLLIIGVHCPYMTKIRDLYDGDDNRHFCDIISEFAGNKRFRSTSSDSKHSYNIKGKLVDSISRPILNAMLLCLAQKLDADISEESVDDNFVYRSLSTEMWTTPITAGILNLPHNSIEGNIVVLYMYKLLSQRKCLLTWDTLVSNGMSKLMERFAKSHSTGEGSIVDIFQSSSIDVVPLALSSPNVSSNKRGHNCSPILMQLCGIKQAGKNDKEPSFISKEVVDHHTPVLDDIKVIEDNNTSCDEENVEESFVMGDESVPLSEDCDEFISSNIDKKRKRSKSRHKQRNIKLKRNIIDSSTVLRTPTVNNILEASTSMADQMLALSPTSSLGNTIFSDLSTNEAFKLYHSVYTDYLQSMIDPILSALSQAVHIYEKNTSDSEKNGYICFSLMSAKEMLQHIDQWQNLIQDRDGKFVWVSETLSGSNKDRSRCMATLTITDASDFLPALLLIELLEKYFVGRKVYPSLKIIESPAGSDTQQFHIDYEAKNFKGPTDFMCAVPSYKTFQNDFQSFSFMLAIYDNTKLHFRSEGGLSSSIEVTLRAGEVCIWTAGSVHCGAGYTTTNSRLFGYLASSHWQPDENVVVFVNEKKK